MFASDHRKHSAIGQPIHSVNTCVNSKGSIIVCYVVVADPQSSASFFLGGLPSCWCSGGLLLHAASKQQRELVSAVASFNTEPDLWRILCSQFSQHVRGNLLLCLSFPTQHAASGKRVLLPRPHSPMFQVYNHCQDLMTDLICGPFCLMYI